MTSLLLLLLVTAMVQVLLRPSVVGAATGVFQDKAGDIDICKAKTCNDIKSKNTEKQKKICKENKEVRSSCPQTCDDVSVFKKECPSKITSRKFERDCSKKYQHNRQCDYDYRYIGCTWDELQCVPHKTWFCDYEYLTWSRLWSDWGLQECENLPNDLPFDDECTPCYGSKPANGCPKKAPTNQQDCSDFENDLTCDYNLMLTGCDPNELQCSPANSFTCSEGKQWEEVAFTPAQCPPSNKCPTTEISLTSCYPTYQDGLECKYNFRFTGCKPDEYQCSSQQTYSCDWDEPTWLRTYADRQRCDTTPIDWHFAQQCSWPELLGKEYKEAQDIIKPSDQVGFIADIVKVLEGSPVTQDQVWSRVRVYVNNFVENIIVSIPIAG